MSVWLAMHASIAAACERARLMTQHVRVPVPTWQQFQHMRTSAASFEALGAKSLRVPFLGTITETPTGADQTTSCTEELGCAEEGAEVTPGSASSASQWDDILPTSAGSQKRVEYTPGHGAPEGFVDTWGLEHEGHGIEELKERALHTNRHVQLVRKAQIHYQCHDAFARVAMAFGTNQLLFAIAYYCLGYISVGDGAPWPAATLAAILIFIAVALIDLDMSFSRRDKWLAVALMATGPTCTSLSVLAWCSHPRLELVAAVLIPMAYESHGLWLLWALRACDISLHPCGEMLPTKFRTVTYLDVFGWLHRALSSRASEIDGDYLAVPQSGENTRSEASCIAVDPSHTPTESSIVAEIADQKISKMPDDFSFVAQPLDPVDELRKSTNHEVAKVLPWLWADEDENAQWKPQHPPSWNSPIPDDDSSVDCEQESNIAGDDDKVPWKLFRYATLLLVGTWGISPLMLYGIVGGVSEFGPKRVAELGPRTFAEQEDPDGTFSGAMDSRYTSFDLEPSTEEYHSLPMLPMGQPVNVRWPQHATFDPRSLALDGSGKHIVVTDEFNIYHGKLAENENGLGIEVVEPLVEHPRLLRGSASTEVPDSFTRAPHCTALEGQALKDVGVLCSADDASVEHCRALVLHSNGRRLSECPLRAYAPSPETVPIVSGEGPQTPNRLLSAIEPIVTPIYDWKISSKWIDPDHESVESLAVNDECGDQIATRKHEFDPDEGGCVVVGTSSGRVVQLRRHVSRDDQLVPEWAVQERLGKVGQGSLHVYPGGYVVMLRPEIGLMQAFEIHQGALLGQWRLPSTVKWRSLAGGGEWLLILGQEVKEEQVDNDIKVWRFDLPSTLKQIIPISMAR
jgi:hypothetical protein